MRIPAVQRGSSEGAYGATPRRTSPALQRREADWPARTAGRRPSYPACQGHPPSPLRPSPPQYRFPATPSQAASAPTANMDSPSPHAFLDPSAAWWAFLNYTERTIRIRPTVHMNRRNEVKRMTQMIQSNQSINSIYMLTVFGKHFISLIFFLENVHFFHLVWDILNQFN